MASSTAKEIVVAPDLWKPAQVQLLVFPESRDGKYDLSWWKWVTENDPESETKKMTEKSALGKHKHGVLDLTIDPLRIIWTYAGMLDVDNALVMPSPEPFPQACQTLLDTVEKWVKTECPPIYRMGFAARVAYEQDSRESAYECIGKLLSPYVIIDPQSTDMMYRINRKRPLRMGTEQVTINRLATWTCVGLHISLRTSVGHTESMTIKKSSPMSCFVELDINTDAQRTTPLAQSSVFDALREFTAMAIEIASKGDIP